MTRRRENAFEPRPVASTDRVMALRLEQMAYRAALASTGRVLSPSMREFLR